VHVTVDDAATFEFGNVEPHDVGDGHQFARDAATVVFVSANAPDALSDCPFDVLLLQRSNDLVFAPGAWVFPGGAASDEDRIGDTDRVSMRSVACRECSEESGIVVDRDALSPVARRLTPPERVRRYDTRFYLTTVEPSPRRPQVVVDGIEIMAFEWIGPAAGLSQHGDTMLPPTIALLSTLATFTSVDQLLTWAREQTP